MDYEKMLEEAFAKFPEKATSKERFDMPVFDTLLQGNQTIIRNFSQVCEKLRRPKEFLARYMMRELATPVNLDNVRLIINGKINQRIINEKLTEFVNNYVICDQCHKPDTHLQEDAHHILFLICEACGARKAVKKF